MFSCRHFFLNTALFCFILFPLPAILNKNFFSAVFLCFFTASKQIFADFFLASDYTYYILFHQKMRSESWTKTEKK